MINDLSPDNKICINYKNILKNISKVYKITKNISEIENEIKKMKIVKKLNTKIKKPTSIKKKIIYYEKFIDEFINIYKQIMPNFIEIEKNKCNLYKIINDISKEVKNISI